MQEEWFNGSTFAAHALGKYSDHRPPVGRHLLWARSGLWRVTAAVVIGSKQEGLFTLKNRAIEAMKHRAKQYHRNKRGDVFTNGVIVRHLYDDMTPETPTFWDDAVFIVNDYRVALWWVHPRHQYHHLVEAEALRRIAHLRPEHDLFADMTPNYKKLGRSRKKVASWTQRPTPDEYRRYFDMLADMERQVGQEVAFEIRPSIKIAWHSWCKGLSLCAPFEVRSESDLLALSHVARRLVKRESTIAQEFGDFVYRQADWLADCKVIEKTNPSFVISHALT